jgi:putative hemolysin
MLFSFNHIPSTGDHFDFAGLRFEVIDMDGNRIDKILVTPAPKHVSDTDQFG